MVGFGFWLCLLLLVPACSQSQAGDDATEPQQVEAALSESDAKYSAEELDDLVAPIALYPDVLIAQILPASTYPLEVVQAARELDAAGGTLDEEAIKKLDIDVSIAALMHYPVVLRKLNDDLDWTIALGDAVVSQQQEVMEAVQRVRSEARAAGNLVSSDQVTVVTEEHIIRIESANPQVIYVPTYNPAVIYVQQPSPVVVYSTGLVMGAWLSYGCNWHRGDINIDVRGFGRYWGRGHVGWGSSARWRVNAGRRAAYRHGARVGSRAGWRAGRRTGARAGARAGARTGAVAGRRSGAVAGRRTGAVSGARAGAATGRRTGARRGAATGRRTGSVGSRSGPAARGNAYGGYRSGRQAAGNSRRGSASRGTGASARRSSASRSSASRSRSSASRSRSSGRSFGGYSSGRSAGRHSSRGSRSRGGGRRGGGRRR